MKTFDYSKLNCTIDNEILGYIAKIHEYKGKQQLYTKQKKDKLEKLVEIAKIQSIESSNKIEPNDSIVKSLFHHFHWFSYHEEIYFP